MFSDTACSKKTRGHDDGDLPACKLLFNGRVPIGRFVGAHDALDAAVVVDVGMADDDGAHGAAAKVLVGQRQRGLRAFHAHERVEHNPARFAFDKRKVRHVVAAHLVDAVHHFEHAIYVVVARVFHRLGFAQSGASASSTNA